MILKYTYYIALIFLCFVFRIDTAETPGCGSPRNASRLLLHVLGQKGAKLLTPLQKGNRHGHEVPAAWVGNIQLAMKQDPKDSLPADSIEERFTALTIVDAGGGGAGKPTKFANLADQVLQTEDIFGIKKPRGEWTPAQESVTSESPRIIRSHQFTQTSSAPQANRLVSPDSYKDFTTQERVRSPILWVRLF